MKACILVVFIVLSSLSHANPVTHCTNLAKRAELIMYYRQSGEVFSATEDASFFNVPPSLLEHANSITPHSDKKAKQEAATQFRNHWAFTCLSSYNS